MTQALGLQGLPDHFTTHDLHPPPHIHWCTNMALITTMLGRKMGKEQDLLRAAEQGDVPLLEKLLGSKKSGGKLAR